MEKTNIILVLVIASLIFSCEEVTFDKYNVDPLLEPYYLSFIKEGKDRGYDYSGGFIKITFDAGEDENIYGASKRTGVDNVYVVRINPYKWDKLEEHEKEMIVFHELGHAILKHKHDEDLLSIMKTDVYHPMYNYKEHREIMLDKLFDYERI